MLWAAMKETPIGEDRQLERRYNYVWTPEHGSYIPVDPPAVTECISYRLVETLFWRCPGATDT